MQGDSESDLVRGEYNVKADFDGDYDVKRTLMGYPNVLWRSVKILESLDTYGKSMVFPAIQPKYQYWVGYSLIILLAHHV